MLRAIRDLLQKIYNAIRGLRYACSVSVICAAASDYAAGDVLSANATANAGRATYFPNLAHEPGGVATIVSITATCSEDAVLTSLRLHFLRQAPAVADVEMDDNAPFDLVTANGRLNWAGSILLNALADRGTLASTSDTEGINKPMYCGPNDTGLYIVITTEVAEANESANMELSLDVYTL